MAAAALRAGGRGLQGLRPAWTQYQSSRGMATLKEISIRLKSVKNIEKITKSMKMVSAAKYGQAERELKPARTYGLGAQALFEQAEVVTDEKKPNHLIIAVSSDRGLCGAIHSNVAKAVKAVIAERPDGHETSVVCIGDKSRIILQRTHRKNIALTCANIGKKPPVFLEAGFIAQQILDLGVEFESAELVFNKFKNVVSYITTQQPVVPLSTLTESEKMLVYDELDEETLRCYYEMTLANLIFYGMKESACSEQSARMTAMDAASKNAGEMIDRLTLTYNRTRQAVITRELIEVISGAAAV